MRKSLSLFLAFMIAVQSFGQLIVYWGAIYHCKLEFVERLESKQINNQSVIIFSDKKQDFQLINEDEILSNGKIYDIVKKESYNGRTFYYALNDVNEDEYLEQVSQLSKSNQHDSKIPFGAEKIRIHKYTVPEKCFSLLSALALRQSIKINSFSSIICQLSPCKMIFSPPPNVLFS